MGKWASDSFVKSSFLDRHERYLIRLDESSAIFEFEVSDLLLKLLTELELLFSDYQITLVRMSGHPKLQIKLRLEEGLWKPK